MTASSVRSFRCREIWDLQGIPLQGCLLRKVELTPRIVQIVSIARPLPVGGSRTCSVHSAPPRVDALRNGGLKIGGTDKFCDLPAVISHAWKSEGMYKEVNRSLIKWPVAASATMLAMSWFPMDPAWDKLEPSGVSSVSPPMDIAEVPDLSGTSVPSPTVVIPSVEESVALNNDQGSGDEPEGHVTKLQDRGVSAAGEKAGDSELVDANARTELSDVSASRVIVKAPVRMIDQELAGLGMVKGNIDLAEVTQEVSGTGMPLSQTAGLLTLEQCQQFAWDSAIWIKGAWSAGFWRPASDLASVAAENPTFVVPESTRDLGRGGLTQAELQEMPSRPSWAEASEAVRSRLQIVRDHCNDWIIVMARHSDRLKDFAAEHNLDHRLRAASVGTALDSGANATVVPVGGVIPAEDEIAIPQVQQSVSRDVRSVRVARKEPVAAWPEAKQLIRQLQQLSDLSPDAEAEQGFKFVSFDGTELSIADWVERVQDRLTALRSLPRLGDDDAGRIIKALNVLAAEGRTQAELLDDRQRQVHWLRVAYAISRRTAVWMPVWSLSQGQDSTLDSDSGDARLPLKLSVQQVRDDLVETGDVHGWNTFLMLDQLLEQAKSGTAASRAILSQRLMSRLQWHSLESEQSQWLRRESMDQLVAVIRPWAHTVVDYVALLNQLEQQEANAIDLAAVDIASAVQTLRFADNPAAVKVSEGINTHYRNANVRLAVSERFMERMIPALETTRMPVNTRVMGARVSGVSNIESDLDIDLKPANDRWLLKLKANGHVQTDSVGRQGAVSIRTAASAKFDAASQIELTKQGLYLGNSNAKVQTSTRLRGVQTAYDGWPLVGTLVRSIAEDRYRDMAPQANRIANREAQMRIESEMDEQLETRVDEAAVTLSDMVLGPLARLQLDPCVTDMQTTEKRLLARYRVAGDWQLGAFTPRPRALSDSLMSVQLHQSALNNTLEQLIPADKAIGIRDLISKSVGIFGNSEIEIPEDIPADVTVQFARTRPITVEIEDGMLWLTLRVLRLRRDEGIDLTQFIVRVGYRPEVNGMNARLVRDGHLRISGPRMAIRERLPVRAIFNKVFATSREIPLTVPRLVENPATEGLVVSQLELRDGWLAIAISEEGAARIALRQE